MNILAIGAHPDDWEYGCAGTLIRHVQKGDKVYLVVVTDGSAGGEPAMRRNEQRDAGKLIGAEEVFFSIIPIRILSVTASRLCALKR